MSQESIDLVKRGIEAYNRRDIDAIYEMATPDFEWVPALLSGFEGDGVRGREGMERYFTEVEETWVAYRLTIDEFRDLGGRVLVLGRIEGRGRGSGLPVETAWGCIFELRDARLSRARAYLDHGEALRAAGLAE
jgi:ketosteroid isomerase-like protein